ncbi:MULTISPECIES: hypothetical protein [Bradyrhizobium]|uniref:hypothetical protein n=1 Tax=Bradyrhizobium TaxID=374 RepID=UPI0003F5E974|nr:MULTISPECIES: hypothetical protein [Bradyrhizobium]QOG19543.1 hypothetical protein FOM02_21525 [Bradyrhizobium sp. SEMIA]UFW50691.1 hypothetical protein BaraCB756_06515 [Bradyrhizobium arachidis]
MSQLAALAKRCALSACVGLSFGPPQANADEARWRLFDQGTDALLAIADTDEPGDAFGLPLLSCTQKTGYVSIEGEAKEGIRTVMAERIRTDQAPWINVAPDANAESATIDLFYSFIDGWRYKFGVQVSHKMFDRFKRDGVIDFKFGKAEVHEEFKVGLDNVGKFLDLCASSTK